MKRQHDLVSELQVHLPNQGIGNVREEVRQPRDAVISGWVQGEGPLQSSSYGVRERAQ